MSLLNNIERRCGNWGIPGLLRMVAILQVVVYVILLAKPEFGMLLHLQMDLVKAGEVWRLLTFCLVPQSMSIIYIFFQVMLLSLISDALDQAWGPFRVNLYFFSSVVMIAVGDLVCPGIGFLGSALVSSLMFLAFAMIFPKFILNLMGILPVPAGWLGLLDIGFLIYLFWSFPQIRLGLVISLVPFLVFALPIIIRNLRHGAKVQVRRAEFTAASRPESDFFHKCTVCGRTDVSNPELEFRVMDDDTERCQDHLPAKG